jgi:alpha-L-fucosidase 2
MASSNQITKAQTPDLVKAVRVTSDRRGDGNPGWSGAGKVNVRARLRDGDHAHTILQKMLTEISIHPGKEDSNTKYDASGNLSIHES